LTFTILYRRNVTDVVHKVVAVGSRDSVKAQVSEIIHPCKPECMTFVRLFLGIYRQACTLPPRYPCLWQLRGSGWRQGTQMSKPVSTNHTLMLNTLQNVNAVYIGVFRLFQYMHITWDRCDKQNDRHSPYPSLYLYRFGTSCWKARLVRKTIHV
jgi:hypothetical protein